MTTRPLVAAIFRYPGNAEVVSGLVGAKANGLETFEEKGVTCCYAKADKYWVRDADGMSWEMYTLLGDAEIATAAEPQLRGFLGQSEEDGQQAAAAGCGTAACGTPQS